MPKKESVMIAPDHDLVVFLLSVSPSQENVLFAARRTTDCAQVVGRLDLENKTFQILWEHPNGRLRELHSL